MNRFPIQPLRLLIVFIFAATALGYGCSPDEETRENPVERQSAPTANNDGAQASESPGNGASTGTSNWLIVPGNHVGPITATTTEHDLIRIFGREHVAPTEVYLGEGFSESGTSVYPRDEEKMLQILWADPEKKAHPASIKISGSKSAWRTEEGVTLGTPLTKVQELNGVPFKLFGFEWDYGGTLSDGNGGAIKGLPREDPEDGFQPVYLSLTFEPDYDNKPELIAEKITEISGDIEFSSDHPAMQAVDPMVHTINVSFPDPTE